VPWLSGVLAGGCLVLGALHAVRLAATRSAAEAVHLAMALGMAAMFASHDPVPNPVWTAVFAACTAGALAAVARSRDAGGEPGHLLAGSASMLFMVASGHAQAGHGSGPAWAAPAALVLAGACAWHALRCTLRLGHGRQQNPARAVAAPAAGRHPLLGTRTGAGAHAVMATGMGAMLLTALS